MLAIEGPGEARRQLRDEDVHAPHQIDCELTQALRKAERTRLTAEEAAQLLLLWLSFGVNRHPVRSLLPRIWQLRANLTPYDASYVALAEALRCPLLTADRRLAGAPGIRATVMTVTS